MTCHPLPAPPSKLGFSFLCHFFRSRFFHGTDNSLPSEFSAWPHDVITVCAQFFPVVGGTGQLCHAVFRQRLFMDNVCCFSFFTITVQACDVDAVCFTSPSGVPAGSVPFHAPSGHVWVCNRTPPVFMQMSDYDGGDPGWRAGPPRSSA